ncbi:hypothetical protein [Vibrio ziniensis]|uniref:Uncharacterized protein n=1 Tax=Vibrio ziniensis TaxID=2711221 RepID=A0A6G7CN86_9VIBR|nr:hypothetical protein [Vibrio ziniensis]QIH43534.1 hypothetical protein G5S32_16185 [Vibrio ziniensis]
MKSITACVLLLLVSNLANACESFVYKDPTYKSFETVELSDSRVLCISFIHGMEYASKKLFELDLFKDKENVDEYWEKWGFKQDEEPFYTHKIAQSYIGVGVWMPTKLLKEESELTTEEWLRSHGLLLSLGFGSKKAGEPRMRMDYRWHEDYEVDLMMHIEVPF